MPSLLGVAICLVCLCSLTWAWFTATQNSGVQPIQSATATVTASLNGTVLGELPIEEGMTGTGTLTLHMDGRAVRSVERVIFLRTRIIPLPSTRAAQR